MFRAIPIFHLDPALRRVELASMCLMNARAALATSLALAASALAAPAQRAAPTMVRLERVPANGLQPQARMDAAGGIHLVWLEGEAKGANVRHASRPAGATQWLAPDTVNQVPGSAIGVGTIRGPRFALGREGRVHVCWNGSDQARPRPTQGGAPLLYTRSGPRGQAFERERNLVGATRHLDGGAAIAADDQGRVYLAWHAAPPGDVSGEIYRAVYLAVSEDDGATFAPERVISPPGSGACGCCGLRIETDARGNLAVLYRAAPQLDVRPSTLLISTDRGATFQRRWNDPWPVKQCPMSSFELQATGASGWLTAWETAGKIHWRDATIEPDTPVPAAHDIAGERSLKHPVLAVNARQETLVAWTSGTGWQRGGALAWRVNDAQGRELARGEKEGVPVWGSLAAIAEPDGTFVLWY